MARPDKRHKAFSGYKLASKEKIDGKEKPIPMVNNMVDYLPEKLKDALVGAAYSFWESERETHLLETKKGEILRFTEIHMVSTIKENPGIHVTALAEKLSVTTGAVSQVLAKLEKKKLILKEKDRLNQSRYLLRLTAEGERIHKNHLKFHEKFDRMFKELISNLTEENMNLIINFLTGIKNKIEGR